MQEALIRVDRSSFGSFLEANPAFGFLWSKKYWVGGATLVVGIAAYVLASLLPAQYVGTTTVQIGSVGSGDMLPQPIEQASVAASRFSSDSFKASILKAAGLPLGERDAKQAMASLSAGARPSTSTIDVQVVATSPESVVQILDAAASTLAKHHEVAAAPRLQVLRDQLRSVQDDMEELDKVAQTGPADALVYVTAATHLFSLYERSRLKALERHFRDRLKLFEPTRAIAAPSVQLHPAGPRRLRYAAVSSLVTLVLLTTLVLLIAPSNSSTRREDEPMR